MKTAIEILEKEKQIYLNTIREGESKGIRMGRHQMKVDSITEALDNLTSSSLIIQASDKRRLLEDFSRQLKQKSGLYRIMQIDFDEEIRKFISSNGG